MNVTISQEEREVLNDLKQSIVELNSVVLSLSWELLLSIKQYFLTYLISLKEFSPSEIKKHGLEQILIRRALRFFGLELTETSGGRVQKAKFRQRSTEERGKVFVKRIVKLVGFPVYVLILTILWIRSKKDVKNKFKT